MEKLGLDLTMTCGYVIISTVMIDKQFPKISNQPNEVFI